MNLLCAFILWVWTHSQLVTTYALDTPLKSATLNTESLKTMDTAERQGRERFANKFYPKVHAEARSYSGLHHTTPSPSTLSSNIIRVVDRRDPSRSDYGTRFPYYSNNNFYSTFQNRFYHGDRQYNAPFRGDTSYAYDYNRNSNFYNSNSYQNHHRYHYNDSSYPKYSKTYFPDQYSHSNGYYGHSYPGYGGYGGYDSNGGYPSGTYPQRYPYVGYGEGGYPPHGYPNVYGGIVKNQNIGLSYGNDYGWVSANLSPGQGYQVNFGVNPYLCYGLGLPSCRGQLYKQKVPFGNQPSKFDLLGSADTLSKSDSPR